MPLTAPPADIPQITDPSTFAVRAQDWVVWQADSLYPFLADEAGLLGLSTTSTSATSNSIGTGAKTFTVDTGKGYVAGQSLSIAYTTTPTNRMFALVTSYNSGTGELIVNVQAIEGSGTYTAWSIALAFNGVISTSQIEALAVTNAKLANAYINDLTTVTFDSLVDYVAIADGSDSGNKKKALINQLSISTPIATTSGTSHDFTSIPSWVKRITLMLSGVSTNGLSSLHCQIGDSGGIETASYNGALSALSASVATVNNSTGFLLITSVSASVAHGSVVLTLLDAATNTWSMTGNVSHSNAAEMYVSAGAKALSAPLDRIRFTTVNGTDTFDAGLINILYE